ncbi:hypothetical membrane protein [Renibacterium salmoninarum ATCC 33209]|uniref:Hypothetical membrane protein n=1 Tax=Renibacterium salmoninarum (strain ATCC 33209 / DSM 20767 / JCM 11484 / NBRC 15589 / NCIMB 2235) TaxID=288705 RepID=A9WM85_RENSM|nr:hypothetical protein [Renibacterium salmoninarum]ABY22217.1 hypothetical membrane protein [Renibacterium salmoninarum ATCC 33209]
MSAQSANSTILNTPAPSTRRIVRRETHRSRATSSVIFAIVLILVLLWQGTEIVFQLLNRNALLASPDVIASWVAELPNQTLPAGLIAAGAGLAIIGLLVLIIASGSGRKARRVFESDRAAVVVDDSVVAEALARTASTAASVQPQQVFASVHGRKATMDIRPTSGVPVNSEAVQTQLDAEIASWKLAKSFTAKVTINPQGAVGA